MHSRLLPIHACCWSNLKWKHFHTYINTSIHTYTYMYIYDVNLILWSNFTKSERIRLKKLPTRRVEERSVEKFRVLMHQPSQGEVQICQIALLFHIRRIVLLLNDLLLSLSHSIMFFCRSLTANCEGPPTAQKKSHLVQINEQNVSSQISWQLLCILLWKVTIR